MISLLFIIPMKIPLSSTTGTKLWTAAKSMIFSISEFIDIGLNSLYLLISISFIFCIILLIAFIWWKYRKRGELDGLGDLINFADSLEKAAIKTIEDGIMTKDLAELSCLENIKIVNTKEFLQEINERLKKIN